MVWGFETLVLVEGKWEWLKIKEPGQTAGGSLWFYVPFGAILGTMFLSPSHISQVSARTSNTSW